MEDLKLLKEALEKPGVGRNKHLIAEQFRERHVSIKWIRAWLDADRHTIGYKYMWLAAMNACIGRNNIPIYLIHRGLCKTNPNTFNAAIEACYHRKIPFTIIAWWYKSGRIVLQLAAMTACIDNPFVSEDFVKQTKTHSDIRIRRIAAQILD